MRSFTYIDSAAAFLPDGSDMPAFSVSNETDETNCCFVQSTRLTDVIAPLCENALIIETKKIQADSIIFFCIRIL